MNLGQAMLGPGTLSGIVAVADLGALKDFPIFAPSIIIIHAIFAIFAPSIIIIHAIFAIFSNFQKIK